MTPNQRAQDNVDVNVDISQLLMRLMLKHKISGTKLADKLGTTKESISRWKNGLRASSRIAEAAARLERQLDEQAWNSAKLQRPQSGLNERDFLLACVVRAGDSVVSESDPAQRAVLNEGSSLTPDLFGWLEKATAYHLTTKQIGEVPQRVTPDDPPSPESDPVSYRKRPRKK